MRNLILSLCCIGLVASSALSSNKDTIEASDRSKSNLNRIDENGLKQGKWIFLGKDQPEKGYPMDGKVSEGFFKDDRKNGPWIIYYKDGVTPKVKGEFLNNRPNGTFIKYHPNGELKEVGTFNKDRYTDSLKRYNEKGVLIYEGKYSEAGKETGEVVYYHDNGQPEIVYLAHNGVPNGQATRYYPNGDVKEVITYDSEGKILKTSGLKDPVNPIIDSKVEKTKKAPKPKEFKNFQPNAYNKVYNENQELWMEGDFKGGKLWDGRVYIYDQDGLLLKLEVYKNGSYHSDGQL